MKGKAVFLAMLLSVLLAGRAEAQRCLPKMRGIEMINNKLKEICVICLTQIFLCYKTLFFMLL